jgi:hypothetical protein
MNQFLVISAISLFSALSLEESHAQEVGRVLFAQGDVTQQTSDGANGPLSKGSVIQKGSTLVVGSGKLQIRFVDGALMSFKPNTRFKINDYQFSSTDVASSKAETQLIEGGLRTITGAVGKLNRPAYRLETATGSIGIRGTEFVVDKAAVTLIEGSVAFIPLKTSATSEVTINAGQTLNGEKPQAPQTINKPVFDVPVAGQVNGIASTRSVESSVSTVSTVDTSGLVTPITSTIQRQSDNILLVANDLAAHTGLATFSLNSAGVPVLTRVEGEFDGSYSNSLNADPGVLIGKTAQLVGLDGSKLQWGVWLDGLGSGSSGQVITNGFPQNTSLPVHWVTGESLSNLPSTGTLTYQSIGQTGSMQIGTGGWKPVESVQSTLSIALSSSLVNLNLQIQGQGATATFSNVSLAYERASNGWASDGTPGSGTVTTSAGNAAANLWVGGRFYGNGATNAATAYRIDNFISSPIPSNKFEAYGVVAYKKN